MGNPKLFILSEQMRGTAFSLTLDKYTIGRSDSCDICIADPTISGKHCTLVKLDDNSYAIRDDNSTNGTKVNDQQVSSEDSIKLKNGDILQVGGIEILYDDLQGDHTESRTISVINLEDTGTGEINKPQMKNLGTKFSAKYNNTLRENRKHTVIINVILALLGVLVLVALVFYLLK
ncbi:MAG: FHA domain-containing protein [Victivallales bacterium]|nr:FHA domain-containing protein [Victivallales bacterium]MBQ6470680.1 FHA domain-containing protein [Victivallales bacterium]